MPFGYQRRPNPLRRQKTSRAGAFSAFIESVPPRPGEQNRLENLGKKLGKLSAEWAPNPPFGSA
jgi:hypothetical protein